MGRRPVKRTRSFRLTLQIITVVVVIKRLLSPKAGNEAVWSRLSSTQFPAVLFSYEVCSPNVFTLPTWYNFMAVISFASLVLYHQSTHDSSLPCRLLEYKRVIANIWPFSQTARQEQEWLAQCNRGHVDHMLSQGNMLTQLCANSYDIRVNYSCVQLLNADYT